MGMPSTLSKMHVLAALTLRSALSKSASGAPASLTRLSIHFIIAPLMCTQVEPRGRSYGVHQSDLPIEQVRTWARMSIVGATTPFRTFLGDVDHFCMIKQAIRKTKLLPQSVPTNLHLAFFWPAE